MVTIRVTIENHVLLKMLSLKRLILLFIVLLLQILIFHYISSKLKTKYHSQIEALDMEDLRRSRKYVPQGKQNMPAQDRPLNLTQGKAIFDFHGYKMWTPLLGTMNLIPPPGRGPNKKS